MFNVTVRQLQVFAEAAERLSLARAAERLNLTPSAVSFQIKQIEGQTGFALFERVGRRVALTEAGTLLAEYARVVLRSLHEADQAMAALKGTSGGRVRLGLVSTSKYIVPHMIAQFRTAYPGVTVNLQEGNRARVLHLLTRGSVDLAVMGQPPADADVLAARFAPHPSIIIAPAWHPLAQAASVPLEALANEPFVMREEGSGTKAMTEAHFRTAGFQPRTAMLSSSNEMIKQAVMAGMGLALLSQHTCSLELALGLLVRLPVEGFPLMRSWYIVQRRTLPLLPVQARLRSFLVEQGEAVIRDTIRNHQRIAMRPDDTSPDDARPADARQADARQDDARPDDARPDDAPWRLPARSLPMPLEALIWDVDGTLAETEEGHRAAFNAAFAGAGLAWHWDTALYARLLDVTGGKERIRRYLGTTPGAGPLDDDAVRRVHAAKTAHYVSAVAAGAVALRPGVRRLLHEAHAAGLRLAIATTTSPANVQALLLATLGPDGPGLFEVIGAGDMVPQKKPAPDIYHYVLDRLALPAERCLAFEDTINGLDAARGAGIPVIVTTSLYGGTAGFEDAAMVVDGLGEADAPCRVLSGPPLPRPVVDVAALRQLTRAEGSLG